MKQFFESILAPQFLIGTLVAGILINLVSHWLINKFPNILSKLSTKWETRTVRLKAEREVRIKKMVNNSHEQLYQLTIALHFRGMATIYYISIGLFLILGTMGLVITSMVVEIKLNSHSDFPFHSGIDRFIYFVAFVYFMLATDKVFEANSMISEVNEAKWRSKIPAPEPVK